MKITNRSAGAINGIAANSDTAFVERWDANVSKSDRSSRTDYERALNDRISNQTRDMESFGIHQVFVLTENQQRLLIEAEARERDLVPA